MLVLLTPATAAHAGTLATGTYVGTTSQHEPTRFVVERATCPAASGPGKGVATARRGDCYVPERVDGAAAAWVDEACSDGTMNRVPVAAAGVEAVMSASGRIALTRTGFVSFDPTDIGSASTFTLQLGRGGASGTIHQTEPAPDEQASATCDSGEVTFTAHRISPAAG
jgi:hypothetical protein